MKTLFLSLIALTSSTTFAQYTPPVQRYDAVELSGHSGATDETARLCNLDITLIRQQPGGPWWVMLVLFSDPKSAMKFTPFIPTEILPLQNGAKWKDWNGRGYSYWGGVLASDDGEISYKIDGQFLFPESAEGKRAGQNGLSGDWLKCSF